MLGRSVFLAISIRSVEVPGNGEANGKTYLQKGSLSEWKDRCRWLRHLGS